MDSYMVRIYRRDENNPQTLVGIVQKVGVDGKEVFSTPDELCSILSPRNKERTKGKNEKTNKGNGGKNASRGVRERNSI